MNKKLNWNNKINQKRKQKKNKKISMKKVRKISRDKQLMKILWKIQKTKPKVCTTNEILFHLSVNGTANNRLSTIENRNRKANWQIEWLRAIISACWWIAWFFWWCKQWSIDRLRGIDYQTLSKSSLFHCIENSEKYTKYFTTFGILHIYFLCKIISLLLFLI